MEVVNSSVMVSRLDLVFLAQRRLDEYFVDSPRVLVFLGYL